MEKITFTSFNLPWIKPRKITSSKIPIKTAITANEWIVPGNKGILQLFLYKKAIRNPKIIAAIMANTFRRVNFFTNKGILKAGNCLLIRNAGKIKPANARNRYGNEKCIKKEKTPSPNVQSKAS